MGAAVGAEACGSLRREWESAALAGCPWGGAPGPGRGVPKHLGVPQPRPQIPWAWGSLTHSMAPKDLGLCYLSRSQTSFLSPAASWDPGISSPPPNLQKIPILSAAGRGIKDFNSQQTLHRRVYEAAAPGAQGLPGIVVPKLNRSWGPRGGRGWLDLPGVAWGRAAGPSRTRCEARTELFLSATAPRSSTPSHHLEPEDQSAAPCPPYNPHGLPPAAASAAIQDTAGISAGESDHACLGVPAFCSAPTTPVHPRALISRTLLPVRLCVRLQTMCR